jgi:hypothetical protein
MSFYPLRTATASQKIRFFISKTSDPTDGETGLVLADFTIDWADVGATFANIDSDGGGPGSTITEIGSGWYEYTIAVTSRVNNAGVILWKFTGDAGIPAHVRSFVGAGAASGRLATSVEAYASGQAPLQPTVAGRTLDVSAGGEAGVDWANVGSPTTTLNLSGTSVKTATDVETDTVDIQSRLPAALAFGRMDSQVGAYASGLAPLQPTTAGRTLDVTATGEAGIDWANIGSPTASVNLSGTSTKAVEPLIAGRALSVSATNAVVVGTLENNVITAASMATDAGTEIATAVHAKVVEGSMSLADSMRLILGIIAGTVQDFETGVLVYKDPSTGAKTRATFTTDDTGRLSVTLGDLT